MKSPIRGERALFSDDHPLPAPIAGLGDDTQHVLERRSIVIPHDAPPGRYRVLVGVWEPESRAYFPRWWHGMLPTRSRTIEVGTLEVLPRS